MHENVIFKIKHLEEIWIVKSNIFESNCFSDHQAIV